MSDQTNVAGDEISLGSIKNFFLEIVRFVLKFLDFIYQVITRRFLIILICTILGLVAGYGYYQLKPRYFQTEMIVQNSSLPRQVYYKMIGNLNDQLLSRSYKRISTELKLSEDQVKTISSIHLSSLDNEPLLKDTSSKLHQTFKIAAKLGDNTIIDTLQTAILRYINENPYILNSKLGERKFYEQRLAAIEEDLRKTDTLKSNFNQFLLASKNMSTFYNNAFNPAEIYEISILLAKEKEKVMKWLTDDREAIILIDGFKTPFDTQSASRKACLLLGMALGFIVGLLIAMLSFIKATILR